MSDDTVIHLPAFSINGETLSGALVLADMTRLCRQLPASPSGRLVYHLAGGKDNGGCLFLTVKMSALLPLVCRRCQEVFDFSLATRQRFWLRGGALPSGEDGGEELESGELPLVNFLTDELLLSLPTAPAHDAAACRAAAYFSN